MSYEIQPVRSHYDGMGWVEYNGFALAIDGHDYLLEWRNTTVWEFAEDRYDHIEIATGSLQRIVSAGRELVRLHNLGENGFVMFLADNQYLQGLAEDLIANNFPHYYQPHPDWATLNCYVEREANFGQAAFESWLRDSDRQQ